MLYVRIPLSHHTRWITEARTTPPPRIKALGEVQLTANGPVCLSTGAEDDAGTPRRRHSTFWPGHQRRDGISSDLVHLDCTRANSVLSGYLVVREATLTPLPCLSTFLCFVCAVSVSRRILTQRVCVGDITWPRKEMSWPLDKRATETVGIVHRFNCAGVCAHECPDMKNKLTHKSCTQFCRYARLMLMSHARRTESIMFFFCGHLSS